jgi:death-on-curing protein
MILDTHEEIEKEYDLKYTGTKVPNPKMIFRKITRDSGTYESIYMRAAHLLRNLTTEHVFEDGNKRTAWTETRQYLGRKGLEPADRDRAEGVLYRIRRFDVEEIATWLESGEIDESKLPPRSQD